MNLYPQVVRMQNGGGVQYLPVPPRRSRPATSNYRTWVSTDRRRLVRETDDHQRHGLQTHVFLIRHEH
jgi:hypothetical protein